MAVFQNQTVRDMQRHALGLADRGLECVACEVALAAGYEAGRRGTWGLDWPTAYGGAPSALMVREFERGGLFGAMVWQDKRFLPPPRFEGES